MTQNEKHTIPTGPHRLRKGSTRAGSAAVQVDLVDSKALADSAEELEMPVISSNHSLAEHSVLEVEEEEVIHLEAVVVELEMSVVTILKLPSRYHSWRLLPVHPGKSPSRPWSIVNHVPDLD